MRKLAVGSGSGRRSPAWFIILIDGMQQPQRGPADQNIPEANRKMVMGRGLLSQRVRLGVGILVTAGALIATNLIGYADTGKPPVMTAKAKRGAVIFQQNCVSCHNKQPDDATPFGPPNLHGLFSSKPFVHPALTPAQAEAFIKKGAAPMPAFGGILTEAQLADLIAYLKAQ
jgi:mono/diheme cytochrome c family protein